MITLLHNYNEKEQAGKRKDKIKSLRRKKELGNVMLEADAQLDERLLKKYNAKENKRNGNLTKRLAPPPKKRTVKGTSYA